MGATISAALCCKLGVLSAGATILREPFLVLAVGIKQIRAPFPGLGTVIVMKYKLEIVNKNTDQVEDAAKIIRSFYTGELTDPDEFALALVRRES